METQAKQKITVLIVNVSLAIALLLATSPCITAAAEDKAVASLIEGAKKEGKVMVYGASSLTEAVPVIKKFEQKYPFLKVEYQQALGETNANRIMTEAMAGRYQADVYTGKLRAALLLRSKGLLDKYLSPERRFFREGLIDPEGYRAPIYLSIFIIAYNTRLVRPQEVPKNYDDLLDPKWKGQVGLNRYEYDWFTGVLEVMGKDKGTAYMEKLAKQDPVLRDTGSLSAQLLAAGEFPLGTMYVHSAARMKKQGAPVEWAKFEFPAPTNLTSMSILGKAPHPNAARLFYDHFLSQDVQEMLAAMGRIPSRNGVRSDLPEGTKLFFIDERLASDKVVDRSIQEFDRIFKKGH
jgi:iron(III) transport system substrate-binding protein